jgi:hypothetical protein
MLFPVLISACLLVGGWSFLSVLGNERQRRAQEREMLRRSGGGGTETPVGRHVAR